MRAHRLLAALALILIPTLAYPGEPEWRRYAIPSTGTSVEMPVSIFTQDAGPPEGGTGRRFFTDDKRADLTVQYLMIESVPFSAIPLPRPTVDPDPERSLLDRPIGLARRCTLCRSQS